MVGRREEEQRGNKEEGEGRRKEEGYWIWCLFAHGVVIPIL